MLHNAAPKKFPLFSTRMRSCLITAWEIDFRSLPARPGRVRLLVAPRKPPYRSRLPPLRPQTFSTIFIFCFVTSNLVLGISQPFTLGVCPAALPSRLPKSQTVRSEREPIREAENLNAGSQLSTLSPLFARFYSQVQCFQDYTRMSSSPPTLTPLKPRF